MKPTLPNGTRFRHGEGYGFRSPLALPQRTDSRAVIPVPTRHNQPDMSLRPVTILSPEEHAAVMLGAAIGRAFRVSP